MDLQPTTGSFIKSCHDADVPTCDTKQFMSGQWQVTPVARKPAKFSPLALAAPRLPFAAEAPTAAAATVAVSATAAVSVAAAARASQPVPTEADRPAAAGSEGAFMSTAQAYDAVPSQTPLEGMPKEAVQAQLRPADIGPAVQTARGTVPGAKSVSQLAADERVRTSQDGRWASAAVNPLYAHADQGTAKSRSHGTAGGGAVFRQRPEAPQRFGQRAASPTDALRGTFMHLLPVTRILYEQVIILVSSLCKLPVPVLHFAAGCFAGPPCAHSCTMRDRLLRNVT